MAKFSTALAILAVLAACQICSGAYTVKRYRFELSDVAANSNYEDGKYEHHCILFSDTTPISVVGTYGNFGYFEGTFIKGSNNALLAWYETTSTDKDGLQSNLGGAQVAYSSDFATVSGGFNVAGITASLGSYSAWKSVKGQLQETSADNAAANNFRDYCLLVRPDGKEWSDVMGSAASSAGSDYFQSAPDGTALQALPDLDRANFASEQGKNRFCSSRLSTNSWYSYTYSAAEAGGKIKSGDVETGDYGPRAIRFKGIVGTGLVGTWTATSGPVKGNMGPNLYVIAAKRSGGSQLIGFYCNTEASVRKECFKEQYDYKSKDTSCQVSASIRAAPSAALSFALLSALVAVFGRSM